MTHPRTVPRGTRPMPMATPQILLYTREAYVESWVAGELDGGGASLRVVTTVDEVFGALVAAPPPRPQVLVLDTDTGALRELLALSALRDAAWTGTFVALAQRVVPGRLRTTLRVDSALTQPFHRDDLRNCLREMLPNDAASIFGRETARIEIIDYND